MFKKAVDTVINKTLYKQLLKKCFRKMPSIMINLRFKWTKMNVFTIKSHIYQHVCTLSSTYLAQKRAIERS